MSTNFFEPKKIGENIKRLIKESEYRTQENFAFSMGADVRTVRRWIHGDIDRISTLNDIARFLNIDVWTLLN